MLQLLHIILINFFNEIYIEFGWVRKKIHEMKSILLPILYPYYIDL